MRSKATPKAEERSYNLVAGGIVHQEIAYGARIMCQSFAVFGSRMFTARRQRGAPADGTNEAMLDRSTSVAPVSMKIGAGTRPPPVSAAVGLV